MNELTLLLISDTHGTTDYTPISQDAFDGIDACICMGDVYETELKSIKRICDGKNIRACAIPGNHEPKDAIEKEGFENIHGKVVSINDLTILGWGGCKKYKDADDVLFMTNEESEVFAASMPRADILVSHSNPFRDNANNPHAGLLGISRYIKRHSPVHFYGHIHERITNPPKDFCIYKVAKVHIIRKFGFVYTVDISWIM